MVRRAIGGVTYTLTYDAENHLTGYSGGNVNASFVYDGDGRRVRATVNGVTTTFVGNYVEWKNSTSDMVRYYYAGGVRLAMRSGVDDLVWLVGDHLGSTSIAVNNSSGQTERQGYKAWGETRFGDLPTNYRYTGQYEQPEIGLYYYNARWYDPALSRWAQPDTIIPNPGNVLDWDRYAYVRNNALKYIDPTGHYGWEVHFALTWSSVFIAVYNLAGIFIPEDILIALAYGLADEIARGNMAADMQNPDQSINLGYLENNPLTPPTDTNKQPHWYTTPDALSMLAQANTPFEFGLALHMLQDSFSHWKKLGEPDSAFQIWLGHILNHLNGPSIDNYDPNNPIDIAMLKTIQDEIDKYVRTLLKIWEAHVPN